MRASQGWNDATSLGAIGVQAAARAGELMQAPGAGIAGEKRDRPGGELRCHERAAPTRDELERVRAAQAAARGTARAAVGVHAPGAPGRLGQRAVTRISAQQHDTGLRVDAKRHGHVEIALAGTEGERVRSMQTPHAGASGKVRRQAAAPTTQLSDAAAARVAAEGGDGPVEASDVESPTRASDGGGAGGADTAASRAAKPPEARARLPHAAEGARGLADGPGARIASKDRDGVAAPKQVHRATLGPHGDPQRGRDSPAVGATVLSGFGDAATSPRELAQRAGVRVTREHGEAAGSSDVDAAAVRTQRERTRATEVATGRAAISRGATNAAVSAVQVAQSAGAAIAPEGGDSAGVANRGIDIATVTSGHQARDLAQRPARLAPPGAASGDAGVAPPKRSEVRRHN